MKKNKINLFVLGLFLLIWATNAYLVFFIFGKYISLFSGLLLLVIYLLNRKLDLRLLRLTIVSFSIFSVYILISYFLDQKTFTAQTIIFDFINIILFIIGYNLSTVNEYEIKIPDPIIIFISIVTILSSFVYFSRQVLLNLDIGVRGLGDESLNAVGVAYIHAQIFILLIWLLFRKNSFLIKGILILASIGTLLVILITESRGAIIYLSLLCFIVFYKNIFSFIRVKNFLPLSIIIFSLGFLINTSLVQNKIENISMRFSTLLFADSITITQDRSVTARLEVQSDFFNNYDKMIFGKYKYVPYPHNQFIEIYMRWGIFGIPIFIVSILSFINAMRFYKKHREHKKSLRFFLFLVFIFCYLQSMSSLSLDNNRLLWLGFGLFLSNKNLNKNNKFKVNKKYFNI